MRKLIQTLSKNISEIIFRYGLAIVLIWLGIVKFKNTEAIHLERAMANTVLFSWLLKLVSIYVFAQIIAWLHIISGILLLVKVASKKLSLWGAIFASIIFLSSILIFASSGITWQVGYGFPELSRTGHSLLKDFILFGASLWCISDSL